MEVTLSRLFTKRKRFKGNNKRGDFMNFLENENVACNTSFEICSQPDKWKLLYQDYLQKEKDLRAIINEVIL